MTRCDDLLAKARRNPAGLKFTELEHLAECHGFRFDRQNGSHRLYKNSELRKTINFQEAKNGEAKPYQVRQLLGLIDEQTKERG